VNVAYEVACALCDIPSPDTEAVACRICGGPTIFRYRTHPARAPGPPERGIWRFREWLPLPLQKAPVSLGEGDTPLVRLSSWPSSIGLSNVYAKLEYVSATGSFKDRGASVLVSHAVASGATQIVEDSSGNAGAAIAAYAAAAGIACTVFAPASTAAAKLRQMRAYGATVSRVEGPRLAAERAARDASTAGGVYYAGHNASPYFVEGCKTIAFELKEAFSGDGPEHLVVPVGGGSLFVGAASGFAQWEYGQAAVRRPRVHLVQAEACMPLVAAYLSGASEPLPVERGRTVAEGIEIESPARGALILRLLRKSGGVAVAVDDRSILEAQQELARSEGIFMEPTSAAAFAGLARLVSQGHIGRSDTVVVAVTGSGLKDGGAERLA
jgi:threonine synthase